MRAPWCSLNTIPASGSVWSTSSIPLVRARTVSLTVRLTFGAQINDDTTAYVYYSPDGNNWDTIHYTSFVIAFTVSTTKQRTVLLDIPEHGYLMVKLTNGSDADTVTQPILWYTIQSWEEIGAEAIESILLRALKLQKQEETGQI
ncbi:MAG: hypothetical protein ABID09_03385 [Candidatus Omnitrophota bacterium]